jgi:FlgN protein
MSALQTRARPDAVLSSEILSHLAIQLGSARRMLAIVLEQATAIRQRQVPAIVRLAGALQAEMHRREVIEIERTELMRRVAIKLDVSANDVTMTMLTQVMDEDAVAIAMSSTAELRGMLDDIQREHDTNRALMRQELAFLDHLLRLAGSAGGYDSAGDRISTRKRTQLMRQPVFELEA